MFECLALYFKTLKLHAVLLYMYIYINIYILHIHIYMVLIKTGAERAKVAATQERAQCNATHQTGARTGAVQRNASSNPRARSFSCCLTATRAASAEKLDYCANQNRR